MKKEGSVLKSRDFLGILLVGILAVVAGQSLVAFANTHVLVSVEKAPSGDSVDVRTYQVRLAGVPSQYRTYVFRQEIEFYSKELIGRTPMEIVGGGWLTEYSMGTEVGVLENHFAVVCARKGLRTRDEIFHDSDLVGQGTTVFWSNFDPLPKKFLLACD